MARARRFVPLPRFDCNESLAWIEIHNSNAIARGRARRSRDLPIYNVALSAPASSRTITPPAAERLA